MAVVNLEVMRRRSAEGRGVNFSTKDFFGGLEEGSGINKELIEPREPTEELREKGSDMIEEEDSGESSVGMVEAGMISEGEEEGVRSERWCSP